MLAGSAKQDLAEARAWGAESALLVLAAASVAAVAYAVQGVGWGERRKYSLLLPVAKHLSFSPLRSTSELSALRRVPTGAHRYKP